MRLRSWRVGSARAVGSTVSAARGESDSSHNSRAGHPGWLRCSSLTYSRYARSSRLAIRAPRSGTYATNHCYRTLVIEIGPLAGLLMARKSPIPGAWIIAAALGGSLIFGIVNHFVIIGADHVTHIAARWRELFATTAVLLAITEIAGVAT